jgi:hypothetical protein
MFRRLRYSILRARRQIAYKVGLDWHMPTFGYLIDYNRDRFAEYRYLDELFETGDNERYNREVEALTGCKGASWG